MREIGSHPVQAPAPYAAWQFELDYPPNTPHKIAIFNPSVQPRALVVASRIAFSQEHVDGPRYLNAVFEGGDMALLEWLAIGDLASQPGLSALVAGDRLQRNLHLLNVPAFRRVIGSNRCSRVHCRG